MIDEILNKLKEFEPQYEAVLPYSGKTVSYSPYKMKDQKILSIISEEKNVGTILKNMCQLIKNCSSMKTPELLCMCDLEYLFLQIRAKSVEETMNLVLEEERPVPFKININEIKYQDGLETKKVNIGNSVSIQLSQPKVKDYFDLGELNVEALYPKLIKVITIDKHRYDLELIETKELTKLVEEIQLKNIQVFKDFLENCPKLVYTAKLNDKEVKIEGFLRFFI